MMIKFDIVYWYDSGPTYLFFIRFTKFIECDTFFLYDLLIWFECGTFLFDLDYVLLV